LNTCNEVLNKTIQIAKIERSKIMGLGVNMPGLIDSDKGINFTYLYQPDKPLSIDLGEKLGLPVFLENDTKARTLAEMRFGVAREVQNALVLQIDWGLGLGMVLNGKLFKGNSGFAGEFSHIPIDENGILCKCGKIGCLETLASGMALVRLTLQSLENNIHSKLYAIYQQDKEKITPTLIIHAALQGDSLAIEMLNQVGLMLGKGLVYLVQILNPKMIILSGNLAQAGSLLTLPIRQSLQKHCLPKLIEDVEILISPLGEDVGTMGSASVVIEQIIEN
jgi:predicted NBD/HSP70 family sugar kinase